MVRPKKFLSCLPTSLRINIREQLAILVLLAVVAALIVVAIPTWIFVNNFVKDVETDKLSLTASLKATRISAELDAMYMNIQSIGSRILVQNSLEFFYQNQTNWAPANESLQAALSAPGLNNLLQCRLYTRNDTNTPYGVLNVTGNDIPKIPLPSTGDSNETIYVSDSPDGYPESLYPTLTYRDTGVPDPANPSVNSTDVYAFGSYLINNQRGLLLGPLTINGTFALVSLTIPIYQSNSHEKFTLGYLTIVAKATSIFSATTSREGLGKTGIVLVIGPADPTNRFNMSYSATTSQFKVSKSRIGSYRVHFLLPPTPLAGQTNRHPMRSSISPNNDTNQYFNVSQYPALMESYAEQFNSVNNASAFLSTTNEEGFKVAVGFARTNTSLANWTVLVEQAREEAFAPMVKLRNILLITVFGTVGVIMIVVIPCAHLSVLPIRRLKVATERALPKRWSDSANYYSIDEKFDSEGDESAHSERGFVGGLLAKLGFRDPSMREHQANSLGRRGNTNIPGHVPDRHHFIKDELTELTKTFNNMSSELWKQYQMMDQKVLERTKELEISKKAAEAANESKTLFIANISHELKTPLNGILGMASVCMSSDSLQDVRKSLGVLFKSGELLLHLLEDLLSFSKNQIGQQLVLKETEFPLSDVSSQISAIFEKQARESRINLDVQFIGFQSPDSNAPVVDGMGPPGTCMLQDMWLWGDPHRIQQVIINLVNNSLKFSNAGDTVNVRIRCLGQIESLDNNGSNSYGDTSRTSSISRGSKSNQHSTVRNRISPDSIRSQTSHAKVPEAVTKDATQGTALSLNPVDPKGAVSYSIIRETTPATAPSNSRFYLFNFEVQDTGPGISSHMQHRVFEPFVQGDLGLSRKFGGTGLGLSICQQLANLMGGQVTLESQVGVGSTFTMQIPLRFLPNGPSGQSSSRPHSMHGSIDTDAFGNSLRGSPDPSSQAPKHDSQPRLVGLTTPYFASSAPEPSESKSPITHIASAIANKRGKGKLRVLVADDNNTNVEVVSRMLKIERIGDVTVAKDGQEAFETVRDAMTAGSTFDLVFMDVQMPNVDGIESTRLIRALGFTAPIVALTAFSEESNIKDCLESGMNEFLSKPIRRNHLKRILKKFSTIHEAEGESETPATSSSSPSHATPDTTPDATPDTTPDTATPGDADRPDPLEGSQSETDPNGSIAHGVPTPPPERASEKSVDMDSPAQSSTTVANEFRASQPDS
ncbi:hypothetical protein TD95_004960 [Thielaviopsis punctulata]|uniref:histidine kinase n=1 Tax=Thielaviopsis punctulata TaxID=72032 RepID=A0A0F4ZDG5_9PEZI|nr:hypothetical protein TD95_004960 [Thielaviopsis punctulata]